ncbi:MAG: SUF system NifU family Fe-S cluster assembly protein [Candidatus Micrarchaeota archaeon]|nr:SUF system NifU family Fe-S cluster assembly protein [Candidatus Micrarchaeota archaeon]
MPGESFYRENILDHYKKPRNFGKLEDAHSQAEDSNPLCGDEIAFYLKFSEEKISEIKFSGSACAICLASASMLSQEAKGKSIQEAKKIGKRDILGMLGIDPGPVRLKCALLPLKVFKLALYKHMGMRG